MKKINNQDFQHFPVVGKMVESQLVGRGDVKLIMGLLRNWNPA